MHSQSQTDNTIQIPAAPDIPGLRFRRYRGEADLPGMVEAFNASAEADGTDLYATLEALAKAYSDLKNSDPARDMVVIEVACDTGAEIVGYSRVAWWVELDGTRIYQHFGFLKPEWRGKGIASALVPWAEARLREIAADHPDTGPRFFSSDVAQNQTGLKDLLEKRGYRPVRYGFYMLRPDLENIPDVPMPEGLEVRPVQPEHLRAIWEAEQEAFRDHWGASEPEEGDYERWLKDSPFQPELWQVAWDGDQVAGMVRTYIDHDENAKYGRKRGYTEWISTRRPWRKRGLARALMARSMRLQKELGMTESALGMDSENPHGALQLYQSMGFQVLKKDAVYRKPL